MTRIRSIHWKEFERFLFEIGCEFKRERGDHRVYSKKGLSRPVVIPRDTSLPVFIILNNLRVLNISREEYLAIIEKPLRN